MVALGGGAVSYERGTPVALALLEAVTKEFLVKLDDQDQGLVHLVFRVEGLKVWAWPCRFVSSAPGTWQSLTSQKPQSHAPNPRTPHET